MDFIPTDVTAPVAYAAGQLTVDDAVLALADAAGITAADLARATDLWLTAGSGTLRYRCSGADPTLTAGLQHAATGGRLHIRGGANIRRLRLIRDSASSAVPVDFELARVS